MILLIIILLSLIYFITLLYSKQTTKKRTPKRSQTRRLSGLPTEPKFWELKVPIVCELAVTPDLLLLYHIQFQNQHFLPTFFAGQYPVILYAFSLCFITLLYRCLYKLCYVSHSSNFFFCMYIRK